MDAEWRGGTALVQSNFALSDKFEKTFMAVAQIRLMTNASDTAHEQLNLAIADALQRLQDEALHEGELAERVEHVATLGRGIIRREWGRVKRGE